MKKCPQCELNYIQDADELCPTCQPTITDTNADRKTFYSMDLKSGDIITFVHAPSITATVTGERTLSFENKHDWHITPLQVELCKRHNIKILYGSGFSAFAYDKHDKNLYHRWHRLNPSSYNKKGVQDMKNKEWAIAKAKELGMNSDFINSNIKRNESAAKWSNCDTRFTHFIVWILENMNEDNISLLNDMNKCLGLEFAFINSCYE